MARKIKSASYKNYSLYYLLRHCVFTAKILGVLPASVDKRELNSRLSVSFRFQKAGLVFTAIQLLVLTHMGYTGYNYFIIASQFRSGTLLQVICVVALVVTRTFLLHLFSLVYRTRETIRCLNEAVLLLSGIQESNIGRRSCIICVMAYILAIPTTFGLITRILAGSNFLATFPFVISNFQENAIVFLIIVLFEIVELSLKSINRTLKLLNEQCVDVLPRLEKLMVYHSKTCQLFESLSHCFGLDVALIFWYNMSKNVLLTYYSYFLYATGEKRLIEHLIAGSDVPYRFFTVWYLGYKSDNIAFQAVETQRLLAQLATDKQDQMEEVIMEAISVFLLQLRPSKLQFSAGGLFVLDRTKLYGMLQMCMTYIFVLVQCHSFINVFEKN